MDDQGRQNLKESFAEDMAKHQRLTGKEPTPSANEQIAVPFFEQLEQRIKDEERRIQPAPAEKPERAPLEGEALRKECAKRGRERAADFMKICRMGDAEPSPVRASPEDLERAKRLQRRLDLLITKQDRGPFGQPSWRERVMSVLMLRMTVGIDYRRILQELTDVVEASTAVFGPWDIPEDEGKPLIFT